VSRLNQETQMTKAAAIGGYQAKVLLVGKQGELAFDGAERDDDTWRPVAVEPAQPLAEVLDLALSKLVPVPSALQVLLKEQLGSHD
jgi:hypothetical protein